jgi:hypothetical protein
VWAPRHAARESTGTGRTFTADIQPEMLRLVRAGAATASTQHMVQIGESHEERRRQTDDQCRRHDQEPREDNHALLIRL